ncbi:MAG: zinc ribbon domain-containing protein [bacterium]
MDFFNDLGKRFSSVAKTVTEKTRDSVEVSRLAGDLRAQKNALEQLYAELGKVCYALRMGEDVDPKLAEQLAESIRRTRERIEELTAQRDALRDVKRCLSCGAVMPKNAKFCSNCGKRLPEDSPQLDADNPADAEYCPDCGAQRISDEPFCAVCGHSFKTIEAETPSVVDVEPEIPSFINIEEPDIFEDEIPE